MRRDEFEGRNRQLPADLNQQDAYANSAGAVRDFQVTPQGTPPDCYDVRSVYSVRPVNGFDFNFTASGEIPYGEADQFVILETTVPAGFVAVLRDVDVWFEPNPPGSLRSDRNIELYLNGGSFPYNSNILIGVASGKVPVYMIADEFNRIGVRVTDTQGVAPVGTVLAFCQFHGDLIQKTDRPSNFEIANRVMTGACVDARAPVPRAPLPKEPERPSAVIPTAQPIPIVAAVQPPKIGLVNVVSSNGRGGQKLAVHDPKNATVPGGFRAITRDEYATYKRDFDIELQKNRKFAPSATLWLEG